MRRIRLGLLGKIVIAIALGIAAGCLLPGPGIRALNTFRDLFGQLIKFFVPLIVIGLVTPAIADTGKSAGRMLLLTMGLATVSTVFSGYYSFFASTSVLSHLIAGGAASGAVAAGKDFPTYFHIGIPPLADIVTSLVFSFVVGLGIVATKAERVSAFFGEFRGIVAVGIEKAVVPFLPGYVLSVVADITACGKLAAIAGQSVRLMGFCVCATVVLLLVQYAVAGLVAGRNPLKALLTMLPAYLTGWGCCSSAATIPVTLRQTLKNGVSRETADLVIPLCSSVHLSGSMCNMVAYAAGVMYMFGETPDLAHFTPYIFMLSVVAIASPGVPGGVVLASAGIVESALGFSPERYALMVAIYMALDGRGTACNLTGDGAIALVVDRFTGRDGNRKGNG